jgi:glycosyltransferase involved in cell wall biosynthesis
LVKRISYFAVLLEGSNTGAAKKVEDQANIWKMMGYQVEIVVLTQENFAMDWNDKSDYKVFQEGKGIGKLIIRYEITKSILDREPDILYLRDSFPFVLTRKKTETKIVLEVQSKLQTEVFSRSLALGVFSILLDTFYLKRIDKFVFVSTELSQTKRFKRYIRPGNYKVISNGIALERISKLDFSSSTNKFELIFLGQDGQPWHGVEQIIELAKGLPEFIFHIVGISRPSIDQLPNLFFYGHLTEQEYLPIARKCCVAIGTLNLKAKKMKEGSSLKLREYLALGLPVIIRYSDSDFMEFRDFILQIPDNEEPITRFTKLIDEFTRHWHGKRVSRDLIAHVDMNVKERARLTFLY